jgi:hypothetical protein
MDEVPVTFGNSKSMTREDWAGHLKWNLKIMNLGACTNLRKVYYVIIASIYRFSSVLTHNYYDELVF